MPMRATMVRAATESQPGAIVAPPPCRWTLHLSPMRLTHALDVWRGTGDRACTLVIGAQFGAQFGAHFGAQSGAHSGPQPGILIDSQPCDLPVDQPTGAAAAHCDLQFLPDSEGAVEAHSTSTGGARRLRGFSLAELCQELLGSEGELASMPRELGPGGVTHGWQRITLDCVLIGDEALARLVDSGRLVGAMLVRLEGAIERADAVAVRSAVLAGRAAWEGDFRAVAVLEAADDRSITLITAEEDLALMLVGENLRQYLSAILDREGDSIGWILPSQVHQLLDQSGSILVRPIETDVYSTFVDVGVCTSSDDDAPAGEGMIYDLLSRSWHTE
jgi:hypothetical protein